MWAILAPIRSPPTQLIVCIQKWTLLFISFSYSTFFELSKWIQMQFEASLVCPIVRSNVLENIFAIALHPFSRAAAMERSCAVGSVDCQSIVRTKLKLPSINSKRRFSRMVSNIKSCVVIWIKCCLRSSKTTKRWASSWTLCPPLIWRIAFDCLANFVHPGTFTL